MIRHLQGRPCRMPETPTILELDTPDWRRVTCPWCRSTKKYVRLQTRAQDAAIDLLAGGPLARAGRAMLHRRKRFPSRSEHHGV